MARWSGTEILAMARLHAQDNDLNGNFAVGAADALLLLNNILVENAVHFGAKQKYIAATTTGLSFSAGESSKETDGDPTFLEVASAHPTGSSSLTFPIAPGLERRTVEEIQEMLAYDGDNALPQQATEWVYFAAEQVEDSDTENAGTEVWRFWVYPVLNRARHLTIKAIPATTITAIGKYPLINEGADRDVARLLGWEIARLKKESTQSFLDSIIAPLPKALLNRAYRGGVNTNQLPAAVEWRA